MNGRQVSVEELLAAVAAGAVSPPSDAAAVVVALSRVSLALLFASAFCCLVGWVVTVLSAWSNDLFEDSTALIDG